MKRVVAAALLVVVCAGCGSSSAKTSGASSKTTIRGGLELQQSVDDSGDENYLKGSGQCFGTGGYEDVEQGASVTVENASGTVIGTGSLGVGKPVFGACLLRFTVANLPRSDFYKIGVNNRGFVTFSARQAAAGPVLTLGP